MAVTSNMTVGDVISEVRTLGPDVASTPDSNGNFINAATIYRWLNEALKFAARITGGVYDSTGIASVSGQRRYTVTGQWLSFDHAWYDGWEQELGNKAETFRNRNLTANISIRLMVDAQGNRTVVELYWTPARTSGTAQTNATLANTDTQVAVTNFNGWLLGDGMALIGSEIVSYSAITSTLISGMIRGYGSTTIPASLSSPANISELNVELSGYRLPATYNVNDSALVLDAVMGWEPYIIRYMLGKFREAEQRREEAASLYKEAQDGLTEFAASNKQVAGPRQCRMYGDTGIRGLVPGGLSGGIIIQ